MMQASLFSHSEKREQRNSARPRRRSVRLPGETVALLVRGRRYELTPAGDVTDCGVTYDAEDWALLQLRRGHEVRALCEDLGGLREVTL